MGSWVPELMDQFRKQAERFDARLRQVDVTEVDFSSQPFKLNVGADEYTADAVIVATGAKASWLGVPRRGKPDRQRRLCLRHMRRVSSSAGDDIIVVGGGDTAMEEALFLTKFAAKVYVVHRRDEFRASKIMAERVINHEKIEVVWNSVVTEIHGEDLVEGCNSRRHCHGRYTKAGCQRSVCGNRPQADNRAIRRTGSPRTKTTISRLIGDGSTKTSVEGVFAAGDVADHVYRQAITAAGTGCMAAIDAERWLATQE